MQSPNPLERRALIVSIVGAVIMAGLGIGFYFVTQSKAILLDGLFSLIGFATALVALRIASLVHQPDDKHYHFGYANFEVLFNLFKGLIIAFISIFAFIDAINVFLRGGRDIEAGWALAYAVVVGIACFIFAFYLRNVAKQTRSPLLELDAKNWIMDGVLTAAVLIAFGVVITLEKSEYAWMSVYADQVIVVTLVLLTLPIPYITVRDNLRQILLGAPEQDIQKTVNALISPIIDEVEKEDYLVRMTRVGRFLYLNIYLVVPPQSRFNQIASQDQLRQQVTDALRSEYPLANADIIFTIDQRWLGNADRS